MASVEWNRVVKRLQGATKSCDFVQVGGIGEDSNQTSQRFASRNSDMETCAFPQLGPGVYAMGHHTPPHADLSWRLAQ